MALIVQEVAHRALHRDPADGARDLRAVAAVAADPRATGSSGPSARRRGSTTSTRASAPPARTSRTPRCAQAYYNALEGITTAHHGDRRGPVGRIASLACALLGMTCEVWQVRASYDSKPYRRLQMEAYGSVCHPSPSELTDAGRAMLAKPTRTPRARSAWRSREAVEVAAKDPDAHYALGSVLNHVMLHQTVIGQEVLVQLAAAGEKQADVVFGCAGRRVEPRRADVPAHRAEPARGHDDAGRRVRAGGVPVAHPGRVPLRPRRRRRPDPAAEDAHARQGLRAAAHPRGRAALPRHGADGLARAQPRADGGRRDRAGRRLRGRASSSPAPRASSPRRSRRTPSPRPSTYARTEATTARWSSSGCPATACSTFPPTPAWSDPDAGLIPTPV